MFGWDEPFPDASALAARRAAAEAKTDELSAADFEALPAGERAEFVDALEQLRATKTA
jgi:hypothetical protein